MSDTYCCGFMFNDTRTRVALIRKEKPLWQRGKLNGIGGKVEHSESDAEAMVREFREETGMETSKADWRHFVEMFGDKPERRAFRVDFFAAVGNLTQLKTMEREKIEIVALMDVHAVRLDMIENLPWLIALAVDVLDDGRPSFVTARYPTLRTVEE